MINHTGFSLYAAVVKPLCSIGGAALLGIAVAIIFCIVLDITKSYKQEQDLMLSFTFCSIIFIIALTLKFGFDMILAEMFFGAAISFSLQGCKASRAEPFFTGTSYNRPCNIRLLYISLLRAFYYKYSYINYFYRKGYRPSFCKIGYY